MNNLHPLLSGMSSTDPDEASALPLSKVATARVPSAKDDGDGDGDRDDQSRCDAGGRIDVANGEDACDRATSMADEILRSSPGGRVWSSWRKRRRRPRAAATISIAEAGNSAIGEDGSPTSVASAASPSSPAPSGVEFRVFQALPAESSEMDAAELERVVSATRAMVFAPSFYPSDVSGKRRGGYDPWADVSIALDLYSPSERRDYLVARGNRCHPDAYATTASENAASFFNREAEGNSGGGPSDLRLGGGRGRSGAGGGGNGGGGGDDNEQTFLAWYDVLARYDELLASSKALMAAHGEEVLLSSSSSKKRPPSQRSSSPPSPSSRSKSRDLQRIASELWKFCVLYNGDGHAYLDYDDGSLLRPLRDVVPNPDGNWAVLAEDATTRAAVVRSSSKNAAGVEEDDGGSDRSETRKAAASASFSGGHHYVHESFLSISPTAPASSELGSMIRLVLETTDDLLANSPLLLPREFHRLVSESSAVAEEVSSHAEGDEEKDTDEGKGGGGVGGGGNVSYWMLLKNECIDLADPASGSDATAPIASGREGGIRTTTAEGNSDASSSGLFAHPSSSTSLAGSGRFTPDARARRDAALCPLAGGRYCCSVSSHIAAATGNGGGGNGEGDRKGIGGGGSGSSPLLALRHPVGGRTFPSPSISTLSMSSFPSYLPYKMQPVDRRVAIPSPGDKNESASAANTASSSSQSLLLAGVSESDLVYISTIRLVVNNTDANDVSAVPTPNFFDILFENDCLPYRKECHRCLKDVRNEAPEEVNDDGASAAAPDPYLYDEDFDEDEDVPLRGRSHKNACAKCHLECPCYCDVLCRVRPPPKQIVRTYAVRPPRHRRDGGRLVPRIVHQTWFEPVTREGYPNMSRLIESWKKSGWEYNFYDDASAGEFLSTHFPPEVREAYESITPGAFKADLFRYCVLLIRGGVYADMDVLLEANLDDAVANDIGFMTPIDEPGIEVGRRSCLWNGLIASAPGHPFLARTIEIAVNNIRNRFTSVDYDDMLCPDPSLSVSHTVDTLFTCGPCLLGAGINNLLGRHMQTQFEVGDVDVWQTERVELQRKRALYGVDGDVGGGRGGDVAVDPDDSRLLIPGRTVILEQNKNDMGAHRFTWADRNLIIAATDMPDYDDRPPTKEHYSKTHEKAGVYGLRKLYTDAKRANEEIRIVVEEL